MDRSPAYRRAIIIINVVVVVVGMIVITIITQQTYSDLKTCGDSSFLFSSLRSARK